MDVTIEHNGTKLGNSMSEEFKGLLRKFDIDADEMIDSSTSEISLWKGETKLGSWQKVPSKLELEFIVELI